MATAERGHVVTAVELVASRVAHARQLADEHGRDIQAAGGALEFIVGDFYALPLDGPYDVVAYWDGFGVGEDGDQRRLLHRIAGWLAIEGVALIDVYTPWYWAATAGLEMVFGDVRRRYDFNAEGGRMLDTWWLDGREEEAVTQSLRCYGPADLRLLLEGTGLELADIAPGGAWDNDAREWLDRVPLAQAMGFMARLTARD